MSTPVDDHDPSADLSKDQEVGALGAEEYDRNRSGLTALAMAIFIGVFAVGAYFLLRDTTPPPIETAPALQDAPTLQDLANDAAPTAADAAPAFSVETLGGGAFTLSQHLEEDGRPIILNLWASWCFPCREEMPTFNEFAAAHPEVVVVGVSVRDDSIAAEEFANELGISYVIGFDEKGVVDAEYTPLGLPATFWIDSDGQIVKRLFGVITAESLEADLSVFDG